MSLVIKPGAVLNLWNTMRSVSKEPANIFLAESGSIFVLGFFTNTFEKVLIILAHHVLTLTVAIHKH